MQKVRVKCAHCGTSIDRTTIHAKRIAVCFNCKKERSNKFSEIYNKTYYQNINNIMKKKYTLTLINAEGEAYEKTFVAIMHKQVSGDVIVETFASNFANTYEQEEFVQAVNSDIERVESFKFI